MNKPLGSAFIREGRAGLELTAAGLFDKIINLKLIRKDGPPIVIRSDYEAVFSKDGATGSVRFKKCAQKPEIKVTYKQVAQSVAIEADIRITNFFLDGAEESADSMFTAEGNPVVQCIIQMGYRKAFPDFTSPAHEDDFEGFYGLKAPSTDTAYPWRQIAVQILTGYRESYPPDSVTYFKGVVGTLETGLRWAHNEGDLIKGYGDPNFPDKFSAIEETLYQFVTRRFIRPSVPHTAETKQEFLNIESVQEIEEAINAHTNKGYEQKIKIFDYAKYAEHAASTGLEAAALARLQFSKDMAAKSLSEKNEYAVELTLLESGIMPVDDANKFGVVCACSNTIRSLSVDAPVKHGLSDEEAALLPKLPPTPFNKESDTLGGQLVLLQQCYPFLRWYILTDGSFYFYHERDTEADLWLDDFINWNQAQNAVLLPAIYDMTPSGTRTIRCPFISFLSPMTTVLFQSRYNIGTLTSFYCPVKTRAFLVITASVEFSTTGEENTMELTCVDVPADEVPEIDPETGRVIPKKRVTVGTPEVAKMQEARNLEWARFARTVVRHKKNAAETPSRWRNIVALEMQGNIDTANYPEINYTEKLGLTLLKALNPEYFDPEGKYMKRGDSIENHNKGIGAETEIKVPWLKAGDAVKVLWPTRPEFTDEYYPPDKEAKP